MSFALIAVVLALLLLVALILWLPVLVVRSVLRERRRRHYRYPSLIRTSHSCTHQV